MDKIQQINYSNKIFALFITDLCNNKKITIYKLAKETKINKSFFYNKINNYSLHYVTLPTIILICKHYNFTFDLLKYINQYEQNNK